MPNTRPFVSVIVPTYNSAAYLEGCLQSIKSQSYSNIELIVVDNNSKDDTPAISEHYATAFYNRGPERSAQRNYGVSKASGSYVLIIDSDMELSSNVVGDCVKTFESDDSLQALVIPEESFGIGFWAQCKRLERSFYVGVDWMEAARAFRTEVYKSVGGYDESMVSGEDWDLSQRVAATGKLGRISAKIMHNEGHLKLIKTLRKKYYYAQKFSHYKSKNQSANIDSQTSPLNRYKLFFSQPNKLFANPLTGLGMLFMKTCEFGVGAVGILGAGKVKPD